MVSLREVNKQLKKVGYNFRFWMRAEIRELGRILDEGETIEQCVNGHHQGGFAILAATNQRLLLIDRKPMFLTLEVIWYDKIGQIDYNHRLLNASICISTPNKDLNFTGYNRFHLRQILLYTQEKMPRFHELGVAGGNTQLQEGSGGFISPAPVNYSGTYRTSALPDFVSAPPVDSYRFMPETPYQQPSMHELEQRSLVSGEAKPYSPSSLPFTRRRYFTRQPQEELS